MTDVTTRTAVCPGSFDPFTLGHRYVVQRAAACFDEVVITVVVNPNKHGMFGVDERIELIRADCADLPNVRVDRWSGLLVDYLRNESIHTIVKGLRSAVDFDYEVPMAQMNRELADVETVFLLTDPRFAHVSSSLVKEVAKLGGDVAPFLSPAIHRALLARIAGEQRV
ncbi:pantetheine-phosphate adenylyltransferase [Gordonia bronchialis DSM 43247]|uniref:Phosphopantetheine adenylyltransferase n=1 Tax=Gordonia bronchialis (strain ATCC 25592 / DSM 43247 / BCRC 13721 / JCM 3198 / KCTC 3076 / NBRC 16047 / NCTC 10667) TaxID=526226 RepID=D0LAK8_GORB4|nr:pantetheine-phosphate adenylyltransferase [Gordonia bronchialis]ACY21321.1 pantetheine-phosphate adenylyltransferase [Gordonia bronchialis DSM 43247]MCC3324105.1 pantetheine-phosphate adenylyltransferase [Gordonia bronchialis]QGS25004.1 pantetheine-phosphate adenylyltransferase [Gordonia bronchialis]UAK38721.1 pantetheine-phosphate adenylyltransferase [Gordonia bronchialis]STQ64195.1 Phosphopantetheine adenylyltransferase [Gordonia bronchialis]